MSNVSYITMHSSVNQILYSYRLLHTHSILKHSQMHSVHHWLLGLRVLSQHSDRHSFLSPSAAKEKNEDCTASCRGYILLTSTATVNMSVVSTDLLFTFSAKTTPTAICMIYNYKFRITQFHCANLICAYIHLLTKFCRYCLI